MNCHEVTELMQRDLDHDLNDSEEQMMRAHMRNCAECAEFYRKLTLLSGELTSLPRVQPAFSIVDSILPRLQEMDPALNELQVAAASAGALSQRRASESGAVPLTAAQSAVSGRNSEEFAAGQRYARKQKSGFQRFLDSNFAKAAGGFMAAALIILVATLVFRNADLSGSDANQAVDDAASNSAVMSEAAVEEPAMKSLNAESDEAAESSAADEAADDTSNAAMADEGDTDAGNTTSSAAEEPAAEDAPQAADNAVGDPGRSEADNVVQEDAAIQRQSPKEPEQPADGEVRSAAIPEAEAPVNDEDPSKGQALDMLEEASGGAADKGRGAIIDGPGPAAAPAPSESGGGQVVEGFGGNMNTAESPDGFYLANTDVIEGDDMAVIISDRNESTYYISRQNEGFITNVRWDEKGLYVYYDLQLDGTTSTYRIDMAAKTESLVKQP